MNDNDQLEVFGLAVSQRQLDPMARGMAARIGDGTPMSWAGFVWHRVPMCAQNFEEHGHFHPRELAHLRFLRWLVHTGRVTA